MSTVRSLGWTNKEALDRAYNYLREKNYKEALKLFERYDKGERETRLGMARCYQELGDYHSAYTMLASLELKIRSPEDKYHVYLALYRLFKAQGKSELADKMLKKIPNLTEEKYKVELSLTEIWNLHDKKMFSLAIERLCLLEKKFPKNEKILICKPIILRSGNLQSDLPAFITKPTIKYDSKKKRASPKYSMPRLILVNLIEAGKFIENQNDFDKVKTGFVQLKINHPDFSEGHLGYARFLAIHKLYDKAFEEYENIRKMFPFCWNSYLFHALALFEGNERQAGQLLLEKIVFAKEDPAIPADHLPSNNKQAEAFHALACDAINAGEAEKARAFALKAIAMNPDYAPAYSILGKYYKQLSEHSHLGTHEKEALFYFEKARNLGPERFRNLHRNVSSIAIYQNKSLVFLPNDKKKQSNATLEDFVRSALENQQILKSAGKTQNRIVGLSYAAALRGIRSTIIQSPVLREPEIKPEPKLLQADVKIVSSINITTEQEQKQEEKPEEKQRKLILATPKRKKIQPTFLEKKRDKSKKHVKNTKNIALTKTLRGSTCCEKFLHTLSSYTVTPMARLWCHYFSHATPHSFQAVNIENLHYRKKDVI